MANSPKKSTSRIVKRKDQKYTAKNDAELMTFLSQVLNGKSRNSIKFLLKEKLILVDGKQISQFNHPIKAGQNVTILAEKIVAQKPLIGIKVIHEDEAIIVINKFAGMLSSQTNKEKIKTAFAMATNHARKENAAARLYMLNSLDKETSGILVFAKSEMAKNKILGSWKQYLKERLFVAWVEGEVRKPADVITSFMRQSKALKVHSSQNTTYGDQAITHYKVIKRRKGSTLLHINVETEVKNQIRVHMQEIGHPIVGDKKYGAKLNTMGRLGLHLSKISLIHPTTSQLMKFEAPIPVKF